MSRNLLWKLIYDFVCKLTAANSWLSAEPKVHQTVRFMILVMLERHLMTTNKFLPVVKIMLDAKYYANYANYANYAKYAKYAKYASFSRMSHFIYI